MLETLKNHTKNIFPALAYRNYRLFIVGHGISFTGSWMHRLAQGYFVYELTGSAFWVGAIDAIATIPLLLFSLFAGVILDRFPKREVLRIAQAFQCVLGTLLGVLVLTDHASLITLAVIGFLSGCVSAVDQPMRFSLPIELVGKKDLHAAYALNISTVNTARIIGPAIGGFLIAGFGVGWAFLLNGLSFLAPLVAFTLISFPPHAQHIDESVGSAIKNGVQYVRENTEIRLLLSYLIVFGIFGWSYTTMLPVFASDIFSLGPSGLGLLFSAAGAGTVLGGFVMSAIAKRHYNPHSLILFGCLLFSMALFFFALHPSVSVALALLFLVGFGQAFQNSTIHTRVQMLCSDSMRGRVSSIQSVTLQGMQPIGSFQIGLMAAQYGPQVAVGLGAIFMFLTGLFLHRKLRKHTSEQSLVNPETHRKVA